MRLGPTRNSVEPASVVGGLLLRMRAWFAAGDRTSVTPAPERVAAVPVVADHEMRHRAAVVLPFPIRGEALLVKLADLLRGRMAGRDAFLLTLSRTPRLRLLIDRTSYIEFHAEKSLFRAVVESEPETTVTLDTTDFDTLVQFIVQYANGTLSESAALEVAS